MESDETGTIWGSWLNELVFEEDEDDHVFPLVAAHAYRMTHDYSFYGRLEDAYEAANAPVEPRKRRVWAIIRGPGDLWAQMDEVWGDLPGTMCDEKYYQYFRMHKAGFDHVFSSDHTSKLNQQPSGVIGPLHTRFSTTRHLEIEWSGVRQR